MALLAALVFGLYNRVNSMPAMIRPLPDNSLIPSGSCRNRKAKRPEKTGSSTRISAAVVGEILLWAMFCTVVLTAEPKKIA